MNKIVSIKKTSAIFLAIVLVLGTIATFYPSFIVGAQADSYLENENNYEKTYGNYNNIDKSKDSKSVSINKIKCINDNININGINAGDVNAGNKGQGAANSFGNGEGYYNNKKTFDCSISNKNTNTNIVSTGGGGGNQTIPPVPPEPTTATLTVNKEIFGCDNIAFGQMNCIALQNNSTEWLDCNDDPDISGTIFCQSLPESIFDIEVLNDQNTLIQEFVGSEQGTTIQNLEPGTYTVNEIKHPTLDDQLGVQPPTEQECISNGFTDGGGLINSTSTVGYDICFEYEDEQGNDCSTITLAAGEERTCTVKNYIRSSGDFG